MAHGLARSTRAAGRACRAATRRRLPAHLSRPARVRPERRARDAATTRSRSPPTRWRCSTRSSSTASTPSGTTGAGSRCSSTASSTRIGSPRYLATNTGLPWVRPSPKTAFGLWRAWYAVALSLPFVSKLVLTRRPQRMARGINDEMNGAVPEAVTLGYARDLARPATAQATVALYRSYLRLAARLAIRRPYRGRQPRRPHALPVRRQGRRHPARATSTTSSGTATTSGSSSFPAVGHFLAEERPELVAERARALFARTS